MRLMQLVEIDFSMRSCCSTPLSSRDASRLNRGVVSPASFLPSYEKFDFARIDWPDE